MREKDQLWLAGINLKKKKKRAALSLEGHDKEKRDYSKNRRE